MQPSLHSMSFSTTSFNLYLNLPFFEQSTTKFLPSSSILFIRKNHRNFCSFKNSSVFSMPVIHELYRYLCHFIVFYHRSRETFLFRRLAIFFHFFLKHSTEHHNIQHFLHTYTCFCSTTVLHCSLATSFNFFHPDLIFAVTASCTPFPELKTYQKYENFATIFITLPVGVTTLSTSVVSPTAVLFL